MRTKEGRIHYTYRTYTSRRASVRRRIESHTTLSYVRKYVFMYKSNNEFRIRPVVVFFFFLSSSLLRPLSRVPSFCPAVAARFSVDFKNPKHNCGDDTGRRRRRCRFGYTPLYERAWHWAGDTATFSPECDDGDAATLYEWITTTISH